MSPPADLEITRKFEKLPVPLKLVTAGASACFADFCTFPLDTSKVRLQVQGATGGVLKYKGIFGTIGTIIREEGPRGLFNGLNAGLQRQFCFASVRLGTYERVKSFYQELLKVDATNRGGVLDISARIFAGLTTGGLAVCIAQPTDVVKIRFQAAARGSGKMRYTGAWNAYTSIFKEEGVRGLWKGLPANVVRNAVINVAEIVCYDLVKEAILTRKLMEDNVPCHFTSAFIAGFCATVVASPVDVVKTRYMNAPKGVYKGAIDCTLQTIKKEGASAFYKGFIPSFLRIGSFNIVMWITYEQAKRFAIKTYHVEN